MLQNLFVPILNIISNCQGTTCTFLVFQKHIVCVVDRRHFGSKILPNSPVKWRYFFLCFLLLSSLCLSPSFSLSPVLSAPLPLVEDMRVRGCAVQRDEFQAVDSAVPLCFWHFNCWRSHGCDLCKVTGPTVSLTQEWSLPVKGHGNVAALLQKCQRWGHQPRLLKACVVDRGLNI